MKLCNYLITFCVTDKGICLPTQQHMLITKRCLIKSMETNYSKKKIYKSNSVDENRLWVMH